MSRAAARKWVGIATAMLVVSLSTSRGNAAVLRAPVITLQGRVATAVFADQQGRKAFIGVETIGADRAQVTVRVCDAEVCSTESGIRPGVLTQVAGAWRLVVTSHLVGELRLSGRAQAGRFASEGCSLHWSRLGVVVSSDAADLAAVAWTGTADGRGVRALNGPRCTLVHEIGVTRVTYPGG